MNSPKNTADHYLDVLESLSHIAGMNVKIALNNCGLGEETEKILTMLHNNSIPDIHVTVALASYFGTGIDTFLPEHVKIDVGRKIYIAGPITGCPDYMDRFADAEAWLKNKHAIPFSPAKVSNGLPKEYLTRKNFMDLGIFLLSMCEQIAFLPGWENHTGCAMEMAYAVANNYPIIYLSENQLNDGHRIRTGEWNSIPTKALEQGGGEIVYPTGPSDYK